MKTKSKYLTAQGFSLVELLVVIAVIAIIAAIAIPNIANITSSATVAKSERNAQNVVSVASAARAAGYTNNWTDAATAMTTLTQSNGLGVQVINGSGTMQFGVSGLSADEQTNALTYLTNSAATTPDTLLYVHP